MTILALLGIYFVIKYILIPQTAYFKVLREFSKVNKKSSQQRKIIRYLIFLSWEIEITKKTEKEITDILSNISYQEKYIETEFFKLQKENPEFKKNRIIRLTDMYEEVTKKKEKVISLLKDAITTTPI